jgi:hypothetical protein
VWHIPYTEENYRKMKSLLDQRYQEWKSGSLKPAEPEKPTTPWWKFW